MSNGKVTVALPPGTTISLMGGDTLYHLSIDYAEILSIRADGDKELKFNSKLVGNPSRLMVWQEEPEDESK